MTYEFKPGEYLTQDGTKVRIYATDGGGRYPLHGAFENDGGWYQVSSWTKNGHYEVIATGKFHRLDLMPPRREVWCWVRESGNVLGFAYSSREACEANHDIGNGRAVKFVEGQT